MMSFSSTGMQEVHFTALASSRIIRCLRVQHPTMGVWCNAAQTGSSRASWAISRVTRYPPYGTGRAIRRCVVDSSPGRSRGRSVTGARRMRLPGKGHLAFLRMVRRSWRGSDDGWWRSPRRIMDRDLSWVLVSLRIASGMLRSMIPGG